MRQHGPTKQQYRIERADDGQFAFAGLWKSWGENGDELHGMLDPYPSGQFDACEIDTPVNDRLNNSPLSCVKSNRGVPANSRRVYTSDHFQKPRGFGVGRQAAPSAVWEIEFS